MLPANRSETTSPRTPLQACPQFSTTDPDEAVHEATKVLAPHQLDLRGDRAGFGAQLRWADLKDTSLYYMDYRSPLSIRCLPHRSYVAVVLPISADMGVSFDDGDIVDVPRGTCVVAPAGRRVEFHYRSPFSVLILTAEIAALTGGLRGIAPEVDAEGLSFDGVVAKNGWLAETLYGLSGLLVHVVDQYSSPTLVPSRVAHTLREQVISTFLLAMRHSRSDQLLRSTHPISSRAVRQAIELVVSDSYAQKTVTEIATGVGVSVRSLELGFRKELGCTPHEYIQKFRLQQAHQQLRRACPSDGTTVTDVALRCGFNHTGRFAALYRRSYGTAPSQTLRAC
ncbi:helix-turn-helix transcriptional regulator [Mycobacterium sp. AZCC_0083]|uniref:helix-turn-helix transcriptional regulator n=1 Tax=Mycobacterium sp. AZCC_0083 TaxID=2735882 RepID=UPI002105E683|nr:helix-turn-helix transcriptional regulator [Mycobacterium sp. AZCC_0083]